MSAIIITGYTGTRHITPSMDAAVYRGAFGDENCVLAEGNQCAGTMASINEFTVASGCVTMQGHAIQISQETLDVSTCATGYARIDLVCVRFKHNTSSLVDSAELVVLEGDAVSDSNTPQPPEYSTGTIDEGATQVDFPLYQITAYGSTVTFEPMFSVTTNLEDCTLSDATIAKWDAILGITSTSLSMSASPQMLNQGALNNLNSISLDRQDINLDRPDVIDDELSEI